MNRITARMVGFFMAIAAVISWPGQTRAQSDGTKGLLDRTRQYVEDFVQRFANVVAEERYLQTASRNNPGPGPLRRELLSDFLLVQARGTRDWYQFRDVREVNGKAVRDREKRLTELFLEPWDAALRQAERIVEEGARYNLVDVGTLNYPLTALAFFQTHYQDRFQFSLGRSDPAVGPAIRAVNFQERDVPVTIVANLRASGRAWVEESTGRIVKTELRLRSNRLRFTIEITTDFAFDDRLQLAVPVEMRDSYPIGLQDMTGIARYGRFRTFQVRTEETIRQQ